MCEAPLKCISKPPIVGTGICLGEFFYATLTLIFLILKMFSHAFSSIAEKLLQNEKSTIEKYPWDVYINYVSFGWMAWVKCWHNFFLLPLCLNVWDELITLSVRFKNNSIFFLFSWRYTQIIPIDVNVPENFDFRPFFDYSPIKLIWLQVETFFFTRI